MVIQNFSRVGGDFNSVSHNLNKSQVSNFVESVVLYETFIDT